MKLTIFFSPEYGKSSCQDMLETRDEFDVAQHPECCKSIAKDGENYKELCKDLHTDNQEICFFGIPLMSDRYDKRDNIVDENFLDEIVLMDMANFPTCADIVNRSSSCKDYDDNGKINVYYKFQGKH